MSVSALSFVPSPSPISRPCPVTRYFGRGRPFRSVSALSFVPPSPISHHCTLSPLILAGAGHLGPSLPSFRPFFPSPPLKFHILNPFLHSYNLICRGRPFRSVSASFFFNYFHYNSSFLFNFICRGRPCCSPTSP